MTILNVIKAVEINLAGKNPETVLQRALCRGALGGTTTWGSGIAHKKALTLYWHESKLPKEFTKIAEDIIEEDWSGYWKETLSPIRISDEFTITPPWCADAGTLGERERQILIDPGMAFGAGDHPTTRLCIKILQKLRDENSLPDEILDVGAGTGVLSIAAAKMGAKKVSALDIDPFCFSSCKRNIALNEVSEAVSPLLLSLDLFKKNFPLVMANIVSGQLEHLAGELLSRSTPGGKVLLSGFEKKAAEKIIAAFSPKKKEIYMDEEGWATLLLGD